MTNRYEELLLPGQRDRIVGKVVSALKAKGQLSARTLNDFRDVFRAGRPIPGFNNDPLRAMPPLLKQHMLERLERDLDFERLIVGVWTDTEPQLRKAVNEHLDGLDAQIYAEDDIDEDFWDAQVRLLAEKHSGYEEDDILLMTKVCYARVKNEAGAGDGESGEGTAARRAPTVPEETLDTVLELLRGTPAALPLWRESVPQFVESLNEIIDEKNSELLQVRGLRDDLDRIQSGFSVELSFFRHGAEEWDTLIMATLLADANGIDEAGRILTELESEFQAYRAITGRADTLAEERERREQRHELEVTIEGMLQEIDELPQTVAAEPDSDSAGHVRQAQSEADPQLREELDALKREREALVDSNRTLTRDADSLSEANHALQGEVAGLNADKQALADEVAELKDQLRISEMQKLNWRSAYEAEMSDNDSSASDLIPSEVESIRQALELAEARYGDRLLLHFNNKSDLDYNYNRPKEIWDALEWLATTYHSRQTGKVRVRDLNESIRNVCSGWKYIPDQSDITFNMYREWYTTIVDGVTHELREHIGRWASRQTNNLIRIAFAWDDDSQRVVVGYIGRHQRSRAS